MHACTSDVYMLDIWMSTCIPMCNKIIHISKMPASTTSTCGLYNYRLNNNRLGNYRLNNCGLNNYKLSNYRLNNYGLNNNYSLNNNYRLTNYKSE